MSGAIVSGMVLAGCGSSIPSDASVEDFCKAGDKFSEATAFADGVKAAEKLHDTGTPEGIPGDARDGLEVVVELVTDSEDRDDLEKRFKKLTAEEKKSVDALDAYIEKTC